MEIWQLERIKEKVEELAGRLEVKIYAPDRSIYRIWYYPPDDVALYARVIMDERKHEKSEKAWAPELVEALRNPATKVRVGIRSTEGNEERWFGSERDMSPLDEIYQYTMDLE